MINTKKFTRWQSTLFLILLISLSNILLSNSISKINKNSINLPSFLKVFKKARNGGTMKNYSKNWLLTTKKNQISMNTNDRSSQKLLSASINNNNLIQLSKKNKVGLYSTSNSKSKSKSKRNNTTNALKNKNNATSKTKKESIVLKLKNTGTYVGEILIGNPPSKYDMLIDTGSSNFVISSVRCDAYYCKKKDLYNPDESDSSEPIVDLTDFFEEGDKINLNKENNNFEINTNKSFLKTDMTDQATVAGDYLADDDGNILIIKGDSETGADVIEIEYGSGKLISIGYRDDVCINKLCAKDMLILQTIREEVEYDCSAFDGILGLDLVYDGLDAENSFINNLYKQNKIENRSYSLYLNNDDDGLSELTIGGIDETRVKLDSLNYFKLKTDDYWEVEVVNMYYGDKTIPLCKENKLCTAIIDSGTRDICFSPSDFDGVKDLIDMKKDCSNVEGLKNIIIQMKDENGEIRDFVVEPEIYASKYISDESNNDENEGDNSNFICNLNISDLDIIEFDNRKTVLLGSNFMKKYYTHFNKEGNSVGIGLAKHEE